MKKLIILALMISPLAAVAQNDAYKTLFNSCTGRKNFSTVHVTKQMLMMMSGNKFNFGLSSIDNVMSITMNDAEEANIEEFKEKIDKMLEESGLSVMMVSSNGDKSISIYYTSTSNGKITEMIISTISRNEVVVVDLVGQISPEQISQLNLGS